MYVIDLELFLQKNKLKQKELAEILGVTPNFISEVNKGKSKLSQTKIGMILSAGIYDTSMIQEVKKNPKYSGDVATIDRELLDIIKKLLQQQGETILSQQRTIECLIENKGGTVPVEEDVANAAVG